MTATLTARVPCKLLADAWLASEMTAYELCQAMGWTNVSRRQASTKVRRALGLKQSQNGNGEWRYRSSMPADLAARFARALDVDFEAVGL